MIKATKWFHATEREDAVTIMIRAVRWLDQQENMFLVDNLGAKTKCARTMSMVGKACKAEFRGYAR